jgi:hypothetical protein
MYLNEKLKDTLNITDNVDQMKKRLEEDKKRKYNDFEERQKQKLRE